MPSSSTRGWRPPAVSERYFTPEEVVRLIPTLTRIMERVRRAASEAGEVRQRQAAEEQRIALSGGGVVDQAAWRADAERLARSTQAVEAGLREVAALGGVTKDLALGLVDFPHLRDGQVVNLCWKIGEESIDYWHGLDEGYAKRRPL